MAVVNGTTSFLALEVHAKAPASKQTLRVDPEAILHARNELRVGAHGELALNRGAITTLRWVDVQRDGRLSGRGRITGDLYLDGSLIADSSTIIDVDGEVYLSGDLTIDHDEPLLRPGVLITAHKIHGRFANAAKHITSSTGRKFRVEYTERSVTLHAVD